MAGITSLYVATVAVADSSVQLPEQFRPAAIWRLVVSMLRSPLASLEPTPQLLEAILSIGGPVMQQVYQRQWQKLWTCLKQEGLDQNKAGFNASSVGWCKASCVKLQLLLEDWLTSGVKGIPGSTVEE